MLEKILTTKQEVPPLVLRLTMGIVVWPHGAQLLLGWFGGNGYNQSMDYFTSQGLPGLVGFLVIFLEFFGAVFIIIGLFTRFFALAMFMLFAGMVLTVHMSVGFFMNWYGNQQGEGYEFHLLMLGMALALLISGGGIGSLDSKIIGKGSIN